MLQQCTELPSHTCTAVQFGAERAGVLQATVVNTFARPAAATVTSVAAPYGDAEANLFLHNGRISGGASGSPVLVPEREAHWFGINVGVFPRRGAVIPPGTDLRDHLAAHPADYGGAIAIQFPGVQKVLDAMRYGLMCTDTERDIRRMWVEPMETVLQTPVGRRIRLWFEPSVATNIRRYLSRSLHSRVADISEAAAAAAAAGGGAGAAAAAGGGAGGGGGAAAASPALASTFEVSVKDLIALGLRP